MTDSPRKLIPEEVSIKLSGEQALSVLLSLASFAKQGLEMGAAFSHQPKECKLDRHSR